MIDYAAILKENPNGVLATQDGDKVQTRVFQFLFNDGKKIYFCTANTKPVYRQLQKNPYVSFCTYTKNFNPVLSMNGKVVFLDDKALKTRALDENPGIKDIYKSADNPEFELFYIDTEEVCTFDFNNGPVTHAV